jgi:regulator of protease activity HflC (stomatin/prohibitin superfamily)
MNIASGMSIAATVTWVVVVGLLVFIVAQAARDRKVKGGGSILAIGFSIAIVLSLISAGLIFINPQERGVVISAFNAQGIRQTALRPGLHWIIPFAETVVRYPISHQTYTMSIAHFEGAIEGDDSIEARTADGQKVLVDASVIFSVDPEKVVDVHINWQDRYINDLVRAVSRGVIRDAVSQYGVQDVYSLKRQDLINDVRGVLEQKFSSNGLILQDFVLRNISFSDEYAASVEQKQIAEQLAQQAQFVVQQKKQEAEQARQTAQGLADAAVIKAEGEAQARVIEAEAEAKALTTIATALRTNPDLLTYQYITKLAPNVEAMFLPNDSPFLFPLPETTP